MSYYPRCIGDIVADIIKTIKAEHRYEHSNFLDVLEKTLGENITRHTKIVGIHNGSLIVTTPAPAIKMQICNMKQKIIENLRSQIPGHIIKDIKIFIR